MHVRYLWRSDEGTRYPETVVSVFREQPYAGHQTQVLFENGKGSYFLKTFVTFKTQHIFFLYILFLDIGSYSGWPGTFHPPASAFQELGLHVCTTHHTQPHETKSGEKRVSVPGLPVTRSGQGLCMQNGETATLFSARGLFMLTYSQSLKH